MFRQSSAAMAAATVLASTSEGHENCLIRKRLRPNAVSSKFDGFGQGHLQISRE